MKVYSHSLSISTEKKFQIVNLTSLVNSAIADGRIVNGFAVISVRHTTTALFVNEYEQRLLQDIESFFGNLISADKKYLHNDIHLRDCPPEEPENAHSHLMAMLLNSSEILPVSGGALSLGKWQSILLAELDGPRQRTVQIQVFGETE